MEKEQQLGKYQKGVFPSPASVTEDALAKLQPDGSVIANYFDDECPEPIVFEPREPVPLDRQSPDIYAQHLIHVAITIYGTVLHIASWSDEAEGNIELLAVSLSPYRRNLSFIRYAASLVKVDDNGALYYPQLPKGTPWEWVPQFQSFQS